MFEICLFDLDDTLVRTEDLKEAREACKENADPRNIKAVKTGLEALQGRRIYSLELLQKIRETYPELKLGVFTRSPRSYADIVLNWAYPGFAWDIVVAYEDVRHRKPHGDGIDLAMNRFNVDDLTTVMLVGDTDVDVRAAYNCGCIAALDQSNWPAKKLTNHWSALELVPDALFFKPDHILRVLAKPDTFLPGLERLLSSKQKIAAAGVRFDAINHFAPGSRKAYRVHVCGRSFTQYPSVQYRRQWHELTKSIEDHKEADRFSQAWVDAIRRFIVECYRDVLGPPSVLVTVVPHRPARKARLESLLGQLKESLTKEPIESCQVTFASDLLAFKDGVKSQHNDYLNREQRFENVRNHLFVKRPKLVKGGKYVLVLDDVVTTGASLIYATIHMKEAGAGDVKCLAIAKSIGDVL